MDNQLENQVLPSKPLSKSQLYYAKNAEIIKAKNICDLCQGKFTKYNKLKHLNSIKHKKTVENNEKQESNE